jgi:phage-related protein
MAILKGAWDAVWNTFGPTVTAVFEGIKAGIKGGINFIIKQINKFIRAANKVTSVTNAIPGVNIKQIPEIPLLAKGGNIVGAGSAVIGENGPELLDLPRGARVTPLGKGGGAGITINFYNTQVLTDDDIVEKIGDPLLRELKKHFATV